MMPHNLLPIDSVLMPLDEGALLVSRSTAAFCRIPEGSIAAVTAVLDGGDSTDTLDPELLGALDRHGFFGAPREPAPVRPTLRLQLTNRCNLACDYCCTDSGAARPDELDAVEWRRAADAAFYFIDGPLRVSLLGGEPLLAPFALDLARYLLLKSCALTLYTNGVLLADPGMAREVATLIHVGAEVRVSLAGPTAEICDRLSGGARFDSAMAGIRHLGERGAPVAVDMMLFLETVSDMAAKLEGFRRQLPPKTPVSFGITYCGGREAGRHMFPSKSAMEAALDVIALQSGAAIPARATSPVSPRREACHCAFGHDMHIRSDGMLFNCFKMEEPLGSIRAEPLADVWSRAKGICRFAPQLPTCADCVLATLCGGGCRSENVLYTGEGDRPLCGPWRQRAKFKGSLRGHYSIEIR